ncbi:MAG: phosphoglucomutase [Candidatus Marinimicrobia bacterium]|nr:phosphoglucomutase [Candidatus Neomarinimicrobiota bacterium]
MTERIIKYGLPDIRFGTDGWRGIVNTEINGDTVGIVADAFARYLRENSDHPSCIVGFDGRRDSRNFAEIFASVLKQEEINTFLSDRITPTPYVSYYTQKHKLSAGVMITASHNPAHYNGIKFKGPYGGPLMTGETLKVENLLSHSYTEGERPDSVNIVSDYDHHIDELIDFAAIENAGLKPLIDSMGGAGETYIQNILQRHSIQAETIYAKAAPDFSGRYAEPIEKNLGPLSAALRENKAYCCGLATDGDADRLGVMTENGEWLSAQETILYLSDYILNTRNADGAIVITSSVTDKISGLASPHHPLREVQVGFKYICEAMLNEPVAIGCEESGGFGFGMHIPERDGILSALIFLEMLARSGYDRLSDFVRTKRRQFGEIHYRRIDHPVPHAGRTRILPLLYENNLSTLAKFDVSGTETFNSSRGIINGLKYRLKGGCRWLLLRASETEPLMRVYAEGQTSAEVEAILNAGLSIVSESYEKDR